VNKIRAVDLVQTHDLPITNQTRNHCATPLQPSLHVTLLS